MAKCPKNDFHGVTSRTQNGKLPYRHPKVVLSQNNVCSDLFLDGRQINFYLTDLNSTGISSVKPTSMSITQLN